MHFSNWLLKRQKLLSPPDKLMALIQAAGPNGIPERRLRSHVDVPKQLVDDLLAALVSSGLTSVVEKGGERVYVGR